MDADEFIASIKVAVHDSTICGTQAMLEHPSGRKPPEKIVQLSQWYNALPESDKDRVREVITLAVHGSVFGLLCVLDGVQVIESSVEKSDFELHQVREGARNIINGKNISLHDIYQSEVWNDVYGSKA
ncbi:MAG: hypothetical protein P4L77_03460 [Sulfuriferula sp.]|nr:hypothetical protein [Sulfuriferula sp.]